MDQKEDREIVFQEDGGDSVPMGDRSGGERPIPKRARSGRSANDIPPTFTESLVVLVLILIVAIGCWKLYGPLIRQMFHVLKAFYIGE